MKTLNDRFNEKVDRRSDEECWLWLASCDRDGYGRFQWQDRAQMAHRVALVLVGRDPGTLTVDHLCRVRNCVNPSHLEVVSHVENTMRGTGVGVLNAAKTECHKGHPFTPENTYTDRRGYRSCRACACIRAAAYRHSARKKNAA